LGNHRCRIRSPRPGGKIGTTSVPGQAFRKDGKKLPHRGWGKNHALKIFTDFSLAVAQFLPREIDWYMTFRPATLAF
jgi:hypothetical protein